MKGYLATKIFPFTQDNILRDFTVAVIGPSSSARLSQATPCQFDTVLYINMLLASRVQ